MRSRRLRRLIACAWARHLRQVEITASFGWRFQVASPVYKLLEVGLESGLLRWRDIAALYDPGRPLARLHAWQKPRR